MLVEEIDFIHNVFARFYRDDIADPSCSLESIFSDLLNRQSSLYFRVSLSIEPTSAVMASEGLRTRSRVGFDLSANTKRASGLIIHKLKTVRIVSLADVDKLNNLRWKSKQVTFSENYLARAYFSYTHKPR